MKPIIVVLALALSVCANVELVPRTADPATASFPPSVLAPSSTTVAVLSSGTVGVDGALITEAPDVEGASLEMKWHLTTYTTCVTLGSYVNCGVHEPVLPGGDEVSGAERLGSWGLVWVGVIVGLVGVLVW